MTGPAGPSTSSGLAVALFPIRLDNCCTEGAVQGWLRCRLRWAITAAPDSERERRLCLVVVLLLFAFPTVLPLVSRQFG